MLKVPLTAGALKASLIANLVLAALLLPSLAGNFYQLRSKWIDAGEERAQTAIAKDLAEKVGKLDALAESSERMQAVAAAAIDDRGVLLAEMRDIADRGRERITVYRERAAQLPAAACPPGPDRMDATNEVLR